ncbi:MAG: hypothetical protein QGG88_09585 [Gammaproteobacteria bacterium]|jgi:hypothetical protein|nr:hypothetical protein [Gammaproteobacteria bacterium]
MALLSFILALLESRKARVSARLNTRAVAHLNDSQLRDVGLYRVDDHIRTIADPLAQEAELKAKQEASVKALIEMRDQQQQQSGLTVGLKSNLRSSQPSGSD